MKRIPIDKEIRKLIFINQDSTCYFCGDRKLKLDLDIHHLNKNACDNEFDNLVLACWECHILQHPNNAEKMLEFAKKLSRD